VTCLRSSAIADVPAPGGVAADPDVGVASTPFSAVPQLGQKRAPGGASTAQLGHARAKAIPQLMQYRAPAGLSAPQLAQVTERAYPGHSSD
jgi:hypothetical protein